MSISMWKGNRLPLLFGTITQNGAAFDLTGGTVLVYMRPANSTTKLVNGSTCTIVDPTGGIVSYAWAADDVDTSGSYKGWFTYQILGKTQDTPEFDVVISEHTPEQVASPVPVATNGTTTIYAGDAYLAAYNRALVYPLASEDLPDLTATTAIVFRVEGEFHTTATALDADTVSVDLTSTQTNITPATYRFQIESILTTGSTATLFRGQLIVNDKIASP